MYSTVQYSTVQYSTVQHDHSSLNRSAGLDLFRICAMLMITVLHIVNQHYGLLNEKLPRTHYLPGLFAEYACFCGVNCFALLSGFLLGSKPLQYGKSLFQRFGSLYVRTLFWGGLITIAGFLIFPQVQPSSVKNFVISFLPFHSCWWYINAYLGLILFLPVITKFTSEASSSQLLKAGICLLLVCCNLPFLQNRSFPTIDGYSTSWLIVCFIWGAMMKKNMDLFYSWKHCRVIALLTAAGCVVIPYVFHLTAPLFHIYSKGRFMSYLSPFCVLESMALLVFFHGIRIRNSVLLKIITFASVNSLGIYLFQTHWIIWDTLICRNNPEVLPLHTLVWQIPAWIAGLAVTGILLNWIIEQIIRFIRIPFPVRFFLKPRRRSDLSEILAKKESFKRARIKEQREKRFKPPRKEEEEDFD